MDDSIQDATSPPAARIPRCSFQVLKTVQLFPSLTLRFNVIPTAGTSHGYHTSSLSVWKRAPHTPPKWKFFTGAHAPAAEPSDLRADSREGMGLMGKEIARVRYEGWAGMLGMHMHITMSSSGQSASERADEPEYVEETLEKRLLVSLKGYGRQYIISEPSSRHAAGVQQPEFNGVSSYGEWLAGCIWRGTKSAVRLEDEAVDQENGRRSINNGNLKLVRADEPERVLALWRNATSSVKLGNLIVYDDAFRDGHMDEEVLSTLVISCLGVVLAERVNGRGWMGGLGKSGKKAKGGEP